MKRINVMIHTEVLDSLESLSNEEIGRMFRLIIKWNKGEEVIPSDSLEKFVWATIYPKLEKNKEEYLSRCEVNRVNGSKGGAPKGNKNATKPKTTEGLINSTENNPKQHNYNYINSSKEEFINTQQPSSSQDESVVSKGLESLEKLFPQGRNFIGIDEVNVWNALSQQEKQLMIKRASMYIRNEKKKDDGKYIKGIGKWMREQIEKGLEEKMPSIKNSTSSDDPRLLKMTDGTIYSIISEKVNGSTKEADKLYYALNRKDLFSDKNELMDFVKKLNKEEITNLLN